ncbi:hypothetical protein ElyMa_002955400 [Elysia marginata]|uniref:Uncharacterized protein n=1 Tax=Elysia marginata TaxID=1093978 RepID=A0AAV4I6S2_9GAST|nr:hypothetical protein ElyMa_002955400 [Elysia marginata]
MLMADRGERQRIPGHAGRIAEVALGRSFPSGGDKESDRQQVPQHPSLPPLGISSHVCLEPTVGKMFSVQLKVFSTCHVNNTYKLIPSQGIYSF